MKRILALSVMMAILGQVAFARDTVECLARGKKTSQRGTGLLFTDARLSFDVSTDGQDSLVLAGLRGKIMVGGIDVTSLSELNDETAYIGYFQTAQLRSNPDYRPRRYVDFVQFREFDAARTAGLERGMWGQFLMPLHYPVGPGTFDAAYVFQAGDHMGGTVHFTCRAEEIRH